MSVTNWAICPKCDDQAKIVIINLSKEIDVSKVSHEEYFFMRKKLEALEQAKPIHLREDYEIGIREGEFGISYSANCSVCGFSYQYKFREEVRRKQKGLKDESENAESGARIS